MSKLYYKNSINSIPFVNIYNNLFDFFLEFSKSYPLSFLKTLPYVCLAISSKESVIINDLASFIAPKLGISLKGASLKIDRFLESDCNDFSSFYSSFISKIISNFKIKHPDKRVHISLDHGDVEDRFTVLMFTLKIGKQSIPLFFRCFNFHDKEAYSLDLFKEGISFCYNLIKSIDNEADIIYLADRFWSTHFKFMDYIDSLGCTYNIRTKGNTFTFVYDKKEKHIIKKSICTLNSKQYHSMLFENISISQKRYNMNLAISKKDGHLEPMFVLTNGDVTRALKDYGYRYGSIEHLFKSFKTNGFFLEETQINDLYKFNSLYTCLCISYTLMTMTGIDYSKNGKCYKYKIHNSYLCNGKRRKSHSFFKVGLYLLQAALDGVVKIFQRFILYDV